MMFASKASKDNICGDKDAHMPNFVHAARDVQNWAFHCVGTATTEEQHYCKFFKVVKV
jgi:hypothetical protein